MNGKTVLVTGSTDGIGKQTALELARMGARVLIHGRDPQRVKDSGEEIFHATGSDQLDTFVADFASLRQVKRFAQKITEKYDRLDVLINNAGVYFKERFITEDGYEMTFQVNHLAPFLLTKLFLPLLKKSAPARIVTVSSTLHSTIELDFSDMQGEKRYSGLHAYGLSKLGNIYMTYELAERLMGTGVTANCLHPGGVDTKMLRAVTGVPGISIKEGAQPSVYLASSPDVANLTGKYFYHKEIRKTSDLSYDVESRKNFWQISEKLVKDYL